MVVATIAAEERRKTWSGDVGTAFLNANLKPNLPKEHLLVPANLSLLLCAIYPEFTVFMDDKGRLLMRIDMALYGIVQSNKAWIDDFSAELVKNGFSPNPIEPCVFNKQVKNVQCTVAFHVDDFLLTCVDESVLESVAAAMKICYLVTHPSQDQRNKKSDDKTDMQQKKNYYTPNLAVT